MAAEQQPRPFGGEGSFNYDHCWVLYRQSDGDKLMLVARLSDPVSGRVLEISTNQPGIQYYSGKYLDGSAISRSGVATASHAGLCLEPQNFPNAPNHPNFPISRLEPGGYAPTGVVHKFGAS